SPRNLTMQREHIDWLNGLAPQSTAQEKDSARLQKKQALLSKISADIDNRRRRLISNSQINVTSEDGKKQRIVNYERRDQTTEFDMDEMREKYALGKVITPEMTRQEQNEALEQTAEMQKHLQTKRMVETMIRELEEAEIDEDDGNGGTKKVKVFSKEDIIEE